MNKDQALNKLLSLEHHVKEDDKTIALEIIKDLKEFFDNKPKGSPDFEWLKIFISEKQKKAPRYFAPRCNFIVPTSDGLISTNSKVLLILKNVRPEGKVYDLIQDKWLDEREYTLLNYSGTGHIDNLLPSYKNLLKTPQTEVSVVFESIKIEDKKMYKILVEKTEFFYDYVYIKKVLSGFKTYKTFIDKRGLLKIESDEKIAIIAPITNVY